MHERTEPRYSLKAVVSASLPIALIMIYGWVTFLAVSIAINIAVDLTPRTSILFSIADAVVSIILVAAWLLSWRTLVYVYREKLLKSRAKE